jgi:hypothetical protein
MYFYLEKSGMVIEVVNVNALENYCNDITVGSKKMSEKRNNKKYKKLY